MRVATKTIYDSGIYRINANLSEYNNSSEIVSTGKEINTPSDDPVGYNRIQSVYTSIDQIEQTRRNITIGTSWTNNTESVLTTINESILTARNDALTLANSYINDDEREAAAEQINDIILNLQELTSIKIDNTYLFSGTETDTQPFVFDNDEWPTSVTYQGNDTTFKIDSGNGFYVDVGIPGSEVFYSSEIRVDTTNNIIDFQENADSAPLTGTIREGEYTAEQLAEAIEDAMELASSSAAFRVTGIANSTGIPTSASVTDYSTLNMAGTGPLQADWDGQNWTLVGNGGYTAAMIDPASDENQVIIDLDGDGTGDIHLTPDTAMTTGSITFDISAEPPVNYNVSFDDLTGTFTIEEDGATLTELNLLWESGSGSGQSIAPDIGFTNDETGGTSYDGAGDVTWGIFQTLFDLRDALAADDDDGISRAITRLNAHHDNTSTQIARTGLKTLFMETRETIIDNLELNLEAEKSEIEDADMVKALSDLTAKQTAYEAALSAYSKITSISILNYI